MNPLHDALLELAAGRQLDEKRTEDAVGVMLDGAASNAETSSFLRALAARRETAPELVGTVRAIRARSSIIDLAGPLLDTCGTGGDRLGMFNISTAAAFVAAAAGVRVAKHGNRAVSGSVGTADVLEAAGAAIELEPVQLARSLERCGFCFLFAPRYHPSLRSLGPVRREIGIPTVFNLAGPLCNPARPQHQIIGVFDRERAGVVASALKRLGTTHSLVVHGSDGADELTPAGPALAIEVYGDATEVHVIDPRELGIERCRLEDLRGGDAADNARILRVVLGGTAGPKADAVALNAGAGLWVAGRCPSLAAGVENARAVLADGTALAGLEAFVACSREECA